jgi:tRNA pseudouridine38-40 synthase
MNTADPVVQRIAVGIEYDGSRYAGWQRQADAPSIQAEVERALGAVADHAVEAVCGGRTDAGVHAQGQVAHFDTSARRSLRGWALGANTELPADIAVLWAVEVPGEFHARYSAVSRTYRYVIQNRPVRPALSRQRVCWVHQPLDAAAMHDAAQCLLGEHDFSAFRASECQSRTAVRRLDRIAVARLGESVTIEVTLIAVGRGDRPVAWVAETLASRDRRSAGITAPAGGLYFLRIGYPRHFGLPVTDPGASAMIAGA